MSDRQLLFLQRGLIGTGALLLAVWSGAWLHKVINQQRDIDAFASARAAALQQTQSDGAGRAMHGAGIEPADAQSVADPGAGPVATANGEPPSPMPPPTADYLFLDADAPDQSLWSPARIEDYRASLEVDTRLPEALLRIPDIDLVVPVLTGTDELTLNRAVGRIPGTARIGHAGNLGIAGHRDGFFRGLKDIAEGARIELVTLRETLTYRISDVWIVDPDDVSVLQPTDESSITLVTCYPFYFVGHAPQRYIVRAVLQDESPI